VGRYSNRPAAGLYPFLAVLAAFLVLTPASHASPIRDEVESVVKAQFTTETLWPDPVLLLGLTLDKANPRPNVSILPRLNPEAIVALLAKIPTNPCIWLASLLPWAWAFILWHSSPPRKRIRRRRRHAN
jgi:hypothetical protein